MVETLVSMLVILHSAPTITAPLKSATLPEIRASSVCANAIPAIARRIAESGRLFIRTLHLYAGVCCGRRNEEYSAADVFASTANYQAGSFGEESPQSLGVIGLAQVGVEQLLSTRLLAAGSRLDGDKHGTDRFHEFRVLHSQHPTPGRLSIRMQKAQTARRVVSIVRRPDLETTLHVCGPLFVQIESVESERLAFGQKNAAESFAGVAIGVSVADINHMELTGSHKLACILARSRETPFLVERSTRDPQLVGELRDTSLLFHQRGFVVGARLTAASHFVSCFRQQFLLVAGFVQ